MKLTVVADTRWEIQELTDALKYVQQQREAKEKKAEAERAKRGARSRGR